MLFGAVILALMSVVSTQGAIDLSALAQTDFSSAAAAAQGIGANVVGDIIAAADENTAYASSVVTATGGAVVVDDVVAPKPKIPKVDVVKPKPYNKYYPYYYTCEDLKDDKCYDIDDYYKCGFCYTPKVYPSKGYACKYYEDVKMVKKDVLGKKYEYETEYVPYCECDGYFVTEGKYCPGCDMLLAELLECAGIEEIPKDGEIEIPASCLEEIDVDEDYLKKCDFFGKKDYYGKKGDKPVYYDPKYLYVKPKYVKPFAQAFATAQATGSSIADAVATAFVGDK